MQIINAVAEFVEHKKTWGPTIEHMTKELLENMKKAEEINAILEISDFYDNRPLGSDSFFDKIRVGGKFLGIFSQEDGDYKNLLVPDAPLSIECQIAFLLNGENETGKKLKRILEGLLIAKGIEITKIE